MTRWLPVLVLWGCATARPVGGPPAAPSTSATTRFDSPGPIDHVVLGIRDLAAGVSEYEARTGVRPVEGGRYTDLGAVDALASLGTEGFLEVLAPDPKAAKKDPSVESLRMFTRLTPVGWAVAVSDLDALRAQLAARGVRTSAPVWNRRQEPDSSRLEWRSVRVESPSDPLLPAFVQWDATSSHPSGTAPSGCRLQALVLETPEPEGLRARLQLLGLDVPVVQAPRARVVVKLSCAGQDVEFR